jgi:hypothetical protein
MPLFRRPGSRWGKFELSADDDAGASFLEARRTALRKG